MREEDLVRAAQAGDAVALGLLLEAHQARLYATALALLRDPTQAQDAVQDALLVAVQRIQDLRDPAAAGAWLHTIVRNACRMRWRAPREWPEPRVAPVEPAHSEIEARLEHMALCD
jgi:RNA polymerase sigma-70 factor (ECF subfamily)